MTFNTTLPIGQVSFSIVLNLVINGWPSIPKWDLFRRGDILWVLNLVINGWPSIQGTLEVKLLDNAIMF